MNSKTTRNPVFIVELLGLFVLMVMLTVVITGTFMSARAQSLYAKHLTEAVGLASDVAEVGMAAAGREEAFSLFEKMEQTVSADPAAGTLEMDFTDKSGKADRYTVQISWSEDASDAGTFSESDIMVYYGGEAEPLYTLHAGSYRKR